MGSPPLGGRSLVVGKLLTSCHFLSLPPAAATAAWDGREEAGHLGGGMCAPSRSVLSPWDLSECWGVWGVLLSMCPATGLHRLLKCPGHGHRPSSVSCPRLLIGPHLARVGLLHLPLPALSFPVESL